MGIDLTFESLIPPQGSKLNEMDSSVSSNMIIDSETLIIWKRREREREIKRSKQNLLINTIIILIVC